MQREKGFSFVTGSRLGWAILHLRKMLGFVPQPNLPIKASRLGFVPQPNLLFKASRLGFVPQPNLRILA
jgi:hypothetical protein